MNEKVGLYICGSCTKRFTSKEEFWNEEKHECIEENKCVISEKEDIINKPEHYHSNGVDPITIAESMFTKEEMQGFYKVNMLKYWFRAGKKDGNSKEQDLQKYEFYSNKLKESVEGKSDK